ncbi:uncharacterized protein LOC115213848 isoform X1 [Argonauta hians]
MYGKILLIFFLASAFSNFSLQVNAGKHAKFPSWLKSSSRPCRKCQPGSYMIRKCDLNHGTVCAPCPSHTFTDRNNKMRHCTPCGTCGANQMVVSLCTKRKDIVCKRVYSEKKFHQHNLHGYQGDEAIGQQKVMEPGSGSMFMSDPDIFHRSFHNTNGDIKFGMDSLKNVEKIPESEETSGDDRIKPSLFMSALDLDKVIDNDTAFSSSMDPNYNGTNPNHEPMAIHAIPSKFAQEEDLIPITLSDKNRHSASLPQKATAFTARTPTLRQKRKGKLNKEKKEKKKKRMPEQTNSFAQTKSIKEAKMFSSLGDILPTVYNDNELMKKNVETKEKAEEMPTTEPETITLVPDTDETNETLKQDTVPPTSAQNPDTEPAETEPEGKVTTAKVTENEANTYEVTLDAGNEAPSDTISVETTTQEDPVKETLTSIDIDQVTTIHGLFLPEKISATSNDSTLAFQDSEPSDFNSTGVILGSVFTIVAFIIVFLVIIHLCNKKRNTKDMRMEDHIKIEVTDGTEMVPMTNTDAGNTKANGEANGHCVENGGVPPLLPNDITCAVNDNYRPMSPTDAEPPSGPIVEDVYDIPENLRRKTQQQQLQRQEQQQPKSKENVEAGEPKKSVPPPGT